jgi:2-keto-4-pentenoate hydratase/2-oxohepta-3-ene-1,7-dioic acid hydratase in catechol pathway
MRLATYSPLPSGTARPGLVTTDKRVIDIPAALGASDETNTVIGIIAAGAPMLDKLRALATKPGTTAVALTDVKLHAPIPRPSKNVFCVGWNYLPHFEEGAKKLQDDRKLPEWPVFFSKAPTTVIGPYDTVPFHSQVSSQCDWEVELGVVIGPGGKDIAQADAMKHVWGYTVINDVSWRDLQRRHGGQWHKGKSLDGSCPMGPWIVTADELDGSDTRVRCWVNGELRQDARTSDLIFGIEAIVAFISETCTLEPGDLILTGTPSGVGTWQDPPQFLQSGDRVRIEIEGLGAIEHAVA